MALKRVFAGFERHRRPKTGRCGRFCLTTSVARLRGFSRDEDGAMFILAMFLFITLLMVAGLSVDLMRHELQRTRLQSTLDRALLTAAHPDQQADRKAVVLDFFERSGLEDFIKAEDVFVKVNADGTEVSAKAGMQVATPFLNLIGTETLAAPAAGAAAKINQLTEVSLVVDVSGSMRKYSTTGRTKIVELRDAATQFSNLLLCNPNDSLKSTDCTITRRKTSISLVPYSTQVNAGKALFSQFDRIDAQDDAYCATFLDADFRKVALDPNTATRQAAKFYRYGNSYKSTNSEAYLSCHTDDWREIVPFESSPTRMRSKIAALKAEGDTAIDIGTKWGAALLHHKAEPAISGLIAANKVHSDFRGRPYDPARTASSKFLVIMTDGQNTRHHHLYDGYRTGPSPIWRTLAPYRVSSYYDDDDYNDISERDDDDELPNIRYREVLSIYKEEYNKYLWFYYRGNGYSPVQEWHSEPFGADPDHCFDADGYEHICATEQDPPYYRQALRGTPEQLTYEKLWKMKFTWGFLQRFYWLMPEGKSAPGRLLKNSDNSDNDPAGIKDIDQRMLDQCKAAKDAGITVYTIEFETPNTTTDVMKSCASYSAKEDRKLYYKVEKDSPLDLVGVFSKIAQDINRLRLIN